MILEKNYDHKIVESDKYDKWVKSKVFEQHDVAKTPFTIVIPPPNVTGKLHIGHAWDTTIQDMIIRYKHLKGFDTLWVPGSDHAGIATQAKVEAKLREEGISRYDLGREKFLDVCWKWKHDYHDFIFSQWAMLGLALDYSKERFTLDEGLSNAVKKVFVDLYNKGLIYQGQRIINWDPVFKTALSNVEVIYEETESKMYYFKYYLEDKSDYLTVATTRPETMFGDVCVVVNPNDSRFTKYIGKKVYNPANNDLLPIIADEYVDIEFGTGAMKCTPAHDPNDYILGKKYNLDCINVMNPDGSMNEVCGKYQGQDRFECRENLVKQIESDGLLVKIEKHINQVGYSERSHAIVEPYLSKQWFVKMAPLAKQALDNQQSDNKVNFIPERFEKIFTNWMSGVEDWCISRQLWWGHRIPAWYNNTTNEVYVGEQPPKDIENYHQDEDVLDTWFSSALWPFSTLGFPDTTNPLYQRYFPTDILVTGYDIIFFWVSRMIFQSLEFTKQIPFKNCLIHGLIRDPFGKKMSKSVGNAVDPKDIIDRYGCDSLRFFLTTNSAPGLDLRYSEEKISSSRNFINKIWNASRFVMMNLGEDYKFSEIDYDNASIFDKDILKKLNKTIEQLNISMDKYDFVIAGSTLYNFIYDDFCSIYIEMAKICLNSSDEEKKKATMNTLYYVLDSILVMIHPFIPFVTEEIYQNLHNSKEACIFSDASWPKIIDKYNDFNEETSDYINEIIKTIRIMKSEQNIAPNKQIKLVIESSDNKLVSSLKDNVQYISRFAFADEVDFVNKLDNKENGFSFVLSKISLFVPSKDLINVEEEIIKVNKEIEKFRSEIDRGEKMLSNPSFTSKAPKEKIALEEEKLANNKLSLEKSLQKLEDLKKM